MEQDQRHTVECCYSSINLSNRDTRGRLRSEMEPKPADPLRAFKVFVPFPWNTNIFVQQRKFFDDF
jgi:hypothetical protein